MIPSPNGDGLLNPGTYWVTWAEIEGKFATSVGRQTLADGAKRAAENLKQAGCKTLYIDGSFITSKERPSDFDGRWDPDGVTLDQLDPVPRTFRNRRAAQKAKYKGELFISSSVANGGLTFLEFFQRDKDTGNPKGIIAIDLEAFP